MVPTYAQSVYYYTESKRRPSDICERLRGREWGAKLSTHDSFTEPSIMDENDINGPQVLVTLVVFVQFCYDCSED